MVPFGIKMAGNIQLNLSLFWPRIVKEEISHLATFTVNSPFSVRIFGIVFIRL